MVDSRSDNPRVLPVPESVSPHLEEQGKIKEFARGAKGQFGPRARLLCRARSITVLVISVALLRRLRFVREVN
jgi:hypothetical protein